MHVSRPPPSRFLRGAATSSRHGWSRCFLPLRRTWADEADAPTEGGVEAGVAHHVDVADASGGWLSRLLASMGHATPTAVQMRSFSAISSGRDVVMAAETGSGKTLAYLMPLVARRHGAGRGAPASLVLCPNATLVQQVLDVAKLLARSTFDASDPMQVAHVRDGQAASADLVVATPSLMRRTLDEVGKHRRKQAEWAFARRFDTLVVDEADMMLTGGYRRDLAHLVDILRRHEGMETKEEQDITHVVQADFAQSAIDFLHRIGRTARAGKDGLVSSMYVEVNKPLVETVREAMEAGLEVEAAFSRNRGFRKKRDSMIHPQQLVLGILQRV
eukprot:jgi/Pico_ML_1/54324/g4689.t1